MSRLPLACFAFVVLSACVTEPVIGSDPQANARSSGAPTTRVDGRDLAVEPIVAIAAILAIETLAGFASYETRDRSEVKLGRD